MLRTSCLVFASVLFAGCSGGGSTSTSNPTPQSAGSVQVLLDTATGSEAVVQFQVAAATLETENGAQTGNLLATPRMVTFADPMGTLEGLTFERVAAGRFRTLHLVVVPGSGVARYPGGTTVTVATAADVAIPLAEVVDHDPQRHSWLLCAHDGAAPPAAATANFVWTPRLSGRTTGSQVNLVDVEVAMVTGTGVTANVVGLGAPLHLAFDAGCAFFDEHGAAVADRAAFLAGARRDDRLTVAGDLYVPGDVIVREVRRHGRGLGNTGPRLIGRITAVDAVTETFVMDVYAEARRGGQLQLPVPAEARVSVADARIQRHRGAVLAFGDLAPGQLAKVEWLQRTIVQSGPEEVEAIEVEICAPGGAGMEPQWQGKVSAVDLVLRTITVEPRGNDPIVVQGQPQTQVTLHVDAGTPIERHEPGRNGRTAIGLEDIASGSDRIWFRGVATGPTDVEASWLRVRNDT